MEKGRGQTQEDRNRLIDCGICCTNTPCVLCLGTEAAGVDPQRFGGALVAIVTAGYEHSAAVTEGGVLFTWGSGEADSDDAGSQVPGGLATTT